MIASSSRTGHRSSCRPLPAAGRVCCRLLAVLLVSVATSPRSHAIAAPRAAIASAHPLATAAGFEILQRGGNAFDAAIAVAASLAVVEPAGSGLGGGGFWLLRQAHDGREIMLDARERAPLAATPDLFLDGRGQVVTQRSIDGPLAAGIPGLPAGLAHLAEHYGRLPLSVSLAPAIRLAREGFPVGPRHVQLLGMRAPAIRANRTAAAVLLGPDGMLPNPGDRLMQPDLAETLERLARGGHAGFYRGETATRLLAGVRAGGGIWQERDLEGYRVIERTPLVGHYHGIRVVTAAPPSAAIGLLEMLNILSAFELDQLPTVTRTHVIVEAMRRAYHDREQYLGDPDFVPIPLLRLVSLNYAAGLRTTLRLDRALPSAALTPPSAPEIGGEHTTHYSILDRDGNAVAATLSINYPFGAAFMAPGTGVLLNDEMDDFAAKPGSANVYGLVGGFANRIEPGKRMLSSMSPTFLMDGDRFGIVGTPGGSRIVSMVLLATLEFAAGRGPADWVRLPRFHHQYLPDRIEYEPEAFDPEQLSALRALGHELKVVERPYGNMQAVLWRRGDGYTEAASDPRGEGSARVQ